MRNERDFEEQPPGRKALEGFAARLVKSGMGHVIQVLSDEEYHQKISGYVKTLLEKHPGNVEIHRTRNLDEISEIGDRLLNSKFIAEDRGVIVHITTEKAISEVYELNPFDSTRMQLTESAPKYGRSFNIRPDEFEE